MNKIKWYARQMLPLRYESNYEQNGKPVHCTWRMWFGRCFNVVWD